MTMHQGQIPSSVPVIQYPNQFKDVNFIKYEGDSDPTLHLIIYQGELGPYTANEKLKKRLFMKSVGGMASYLFSLLDKFDEIFSRLNYL